MTGLASDHDAAIDLVLEGYGRLESLDPDNELLQFYRRTPEGLELQDGREEAFFDRFQDADDRKSGHVKIAKVLGTYFVALRDAADRIEKYNRLNDDGR